MSKRMTKHTLDEKIQAVLDVIKNKKSVNVTAKKYEVDNTTIQAWVRKYKVDGVDGLKENMKRKTYSKKLKKRAITYYLDGKARLKDTCAKFNISDPSVLRQWIKLYTSGKKRNPTSKGRNIMNKTKRRKTTFQDRRGKSLASKPSLTDGERLKLRIKELENRNEYLETENGLLKKLLETMDEKSVCCCFSG